MANPPFWRWAWLATLPVAVAAEEVNEDTLAADAAFLEYLGTWQDDDADWIAVSEWEEADAQEATVEQEKEDEAQEG